MTTLALDETSTDVRILLVANPDSRADYLGALYYLQQLVLAA